MRTFLRPVNSLIMTDTFTILLAGNLRSTSRLRDQIAGTRIIAADGGIAHALALNLEPELWVGDFDSCDPALLDELKHIQQQAHPTEKNETDGELAIAEAAARGAGSLVLAGGLGGAVRSCRSALCPGHSTRTQRVTGVHNQRR